MIGFIPFPKVLVQCEIQSALSRIWTRVAVSLSYDDNHYTTGTSVTIEYQSFIPSNHRRSLSKNLLETLLFVNFSKAFKSIHRGKIEQKLLAYGFPRETAEAIMMLYKNTKVKVHSPDGDTDFFHIVASVRSGDTLALSLFIICQD